MLVAIGAVLVIGAGGFGEALAIYALYQDQAGAFTGQIVLASAVFLNHRGRRRPGTDLLQVRR